MARPFPNTFGKDSPMTPQSAASNISYQTNVTRQKTKKWAEAKTVNYGGDDWGEGEDDEYDYDPPPPPPPASKPTGLRQPGQAAQASSNADSPIVDNSRKYGDLPPLPGPSGHARTHSFDADDEKRNFSGSTIRQPSPPRSNAPATRFSQITGVPTIRNPSGPPALSISTQQPPQPIPKQNPIVPIAPSAQSDAQSVSRGNPGDASSITSSASDLVTPSTASDYHARRDFSPSAVPPPLTTRPSAGPPSAIEPTATRFPARKSSLSQSSGPPLEEIMRGSGEQETAKPWAGSAARESSPSATSRSLTAVSGKAPPFIRPADIYKRRMEEEREKERQSMESSRPSMDSLMDSRQSEGSASPATHQLRHKTSSESLGTANRRGPSNDAEDVSDSGRRLMPMLDTVQERKSEYGFEGVDVNKAASQEPSHITSQPSHLDAEEARRLSISPKLPDLNRISSFNMDMFSQPDSSATRDLEATPTTASTSRDFSANDPDLSLKTQPSLGFRSVVSQAFDTSVPPTPASRSGSGVRRTDRESTGTAGISPIISRASSNPVTGSRQPEMSILKVINEPNSPESTQKPKSETQHERDFPGFKMGHRRDISTPSRGNSPARTPDLGIIPPIIPTGQEAEVAIASQEYVLLDVDEGLQASRPVAGREQSFRPSLPGGWISSSTIEAPSGSISRQQTPVPEALLTSHKPDGEEDLTPTTTKQSLPQSTFEAAAVSATVPRVASAALGEHDAANPIPVVHTESPRELQIANTDMAPSGNVSSAAVLDPSVLPKLEQSPPGTQLRPDTVSREISDNSNVAPTPPPKDTPKMESMASKSGYFPKSAAPPVQDPSPEDDESEGEWDSPTREALPILTTGTPPSDDENERLREEIVKSLSPQPSDATRREETPMSDQLDDNAYTGQGRDSTYLPSEYDNYWASTEENNTPPVLAGSSQLPGAPPSEAPALAYQDRAVAAEVAPLSSHRSEQASLEPPRPSLQNRFSWEASTENASTLGQSSNISGVPLSTGAIVSELPAQDVMPLSELDASSTLPSPLAPAASLENESWRSDKDSAPAHTEGPSTYGRVAGIVAGAAAVGGVAAAAYAQNQSGQPQRRLSLAEEKDPLISSTSYPVSPTPPEDEHPSRSPQPYLPLSTGSLSNPAPSTVSPVDTPTQQQFPPTSKLISFRDIMAITSPQQRIQAFNNTRQHWASIDPGLNDWMTRLQGQYPEHADATGSWSGPRSGVPVGSARSKFPKSSGTAPPLQQPYYQQYLNASSPTTTNPSTPTKAGPEPGPSFQPTAQQGFAPAGGKLTSQQVQARGKDFLHTAGIFGGKAGKAGKGLLAKGKNRLRGAGGGDKTSPPPPKPKNERRSSWGFPRGLSRSSNRNDSSSRHSKDSTPTPTFQRSRAATTTSWDASPGKGMSPLAVTQSHRTMSGALPYEQPQPPMTPPMVRPVIEDSPSNPITIPVPEQDNVSDYLEERDALNIPAPISKNQPSWDPFTAAPISEEGSQLDEPPKEAQVSSLSHPTRPSLFVPSDAMSKSERSNSDEARFFNATEEPTDNNDWVMVSPNHDSKETLSKDEPVLVSNGDNLLESATVEDEPIPQTANKLEGQDTPELEIAKPITPPTTSIINRPRGSSYDYPLQPGSAKSPKSSSTSPITARFNTITAPRTSFDIPPVLNPAPITTPLQAEPIQQDMEKQSSASSFLPPIRRTSTFGLGFGSRHPRPRFPIEDADDVASPPETQTRDIQLPAQDVRAADPMVSPTEATQPPAQYQNQIKPSAPQSIGISGPPNQRQSRQGQFSPSRSQPQQTNNQGPMWTARPPLTQVSSSTYSQQSMPVQREHRAPISPPRPADILQRPELRESQIEWRPNRPKATGALPTTISPSYMKEMDLQPSRNNSWEPGAEQEITRPTQAPAQEAQYDEKPVWAGPPQQQRPYEQPPSSAQRYPELFRPGQAGADVPRGSVDLPAQYYQAPISRTAAFLPRQQTNEYQLPGVGPPEPTPAGTSRRNSGFFKEIGGRLSRASSRERRSNSISRRERRSNSISRDQPLSHGGEYADSIAPSEAAQEHQRKRSNFFGVLHTSTSGIATPASRESVIAHHGASRVNLVPTPPTPSSPVIREDKKKILFGGSHLTAPKPKSSKMARASTGSTGTVGSSKKNRFSGLSSMFGKSSQSTRTPVQGQPQATRELSHHERQPLESPLLIATKPMTNKPTTPVADTRSPSQSKSPFSKLAHSATSPTSPARENKPRRPSASGLLNGFMSRKSNTDRGSDDSRSQGSASNRTVQPVLLAQTYSDLNDEVPPTASVHTPQVQRDPDLRTFDERFPDPRISNQNKAVQNPERGRRTSKEQRLYVEPQYDSVPIPGGYSLVRGQGAIGVHTDYDPRGLNQMQHYSQSPVPGQDQRYNGPQEQHPEQQYASFQRMHQSQPMTYQQGLPETTAAHRVQQSYPVTVEQRRQPQLQKPKLNNISTYQNYQNGPRLSREDLLARSPPKSLEGQQRPYQISLPGGDDEDERPLPVRKDPMQPSSARPAVKAGRAGAILRLQQPTLRHPESPAGYPLPEDTVFSPINPGVNDIPPPPPPKWPSHLDQQHIHERHQSLTPSVSTMDLDLDRSNTRRTAVSAISGFSRDDPAPAPAQHHNGGGLSVPGKDGHIVASNGSNERSGRGNSLNSHSPTPPSPMRGTPERGMSPEAPRDEIRRTEVHVPTRPTSQEDLYNASPRLPKPKLDTDTHANGNGNANPMALQTTGLVRSNAISDVNDENLNGRVVEGKDKGKQLQEEKIHYSGRQSQGGLHASDETEETETAAMSATSYPGQEWNPYMAGGWDEGYD